MSSKEERDATLQRSEPPHHNEPMLADLITSREAVGIDTPVTAIADRFRRERSLEAVCVVDAQGTPAGLLDRTKLLVKLSQQYGHALYGRATVGKVLEGAPVILPAQTRMSSVLRDVLGRDAAGLYDAIVVVDDDRNFIGLVSFRQLIVQQTHALANVTLERQLIGQRAQELERTADVKSQFLGHVTHELRAPVNAMIGIVDLLTHSTREGDVARMEEMLTLLASSATSLRAIINNVLDLSKIEAGHMGVFVDSFDVDAIIREVASVTRVLIGRKPVSVEVVAHEGPTVLRSDSIKVKQIFTNLASNAAKFTSQGQIRFEVSVEQDAVSVCVRDTGLGIASDQLALIFEPFAQVGDIKTRANEGTGLGLTITSHLTQLLSGTLRVESQLGVGSAFRIRLPHLKEQAT